MPFFYIPRIDNTNGNIIAIINKTMIIMNAIPIPISTLKFFFVIANVIPIIVVVISNKTIINILKYIIKFAVFIISPFESRLL